MSLPDDGIALLSHDQLLQIFAEDGPLATATAGFRVRSGQVELAQAIAKAIASPTQLIAEAGTGTGKTFAYLIPALLSGQKVLVSTGTKTLQDQLFHRDLPRLLKTLNLQSHVALLKGRSNYVCHFHLQRNLREGRFEKASDGATLRKIEWFSARSNSGDRADCHEVEEGHDAWSYATSTRDNCLGQDCPDWERCFVIRARKEAQAADLVVINHHLYCADSSLKDEGVAELLPSANVLIFDEAHQLPETCVQFFGTTISTRQLLDWVRDTRTSGLSEAKDMLGWSELLDPLERCIRDFRLAWPQNSPRLAGQSLVNEREFSVTLGQLLQQWHETIDKLGPAAVRGPSLERALVRAIELETGLQAWAKALNELASVSSSPISPANTEADPASEQWDEGDGPAVCWGQTSGQNLSLHLTPLYIGRIFARRLEALGAISAIFLSATLSVDQKFDFFKRQLGLLDAQTASWPSPFDYARNGLLYLPQHLGDPNHPDFTVRLLQEVWPLVLGNRGRAFLLFTTLRAVRKAADWLRLQLGALEANGQAFGAELLVQGEMSKGVQLEKFRAAKAPILVGSASFWEGVDVVGEQLSLVIIDKLPFAPPDEPMLQARVEALKKRGLDSFSTLQVPAAAIAMKQGAGRLIRSETDRGLLVIGDARIIQKPYGKRILRSMPAFSQTTDAAVAQQWVQVRPEILDG